MATFGRVIPPEEVAALSSQRSGSRIDLAPYTEYVSSIPTDAAGEIALDPKDSKATIKRRVTLAAKALGRNITYLRTGEKTLIFVVKSTPDAKTKAVTKPSKEPKTNGKHASVESSLEAELVPA